MTQRSHPVELALHRFFPHLDYPTLRTLSAVQRTRLAMAIQRTPVTAPIGVNATLRYLLAQVFECDPSSFRTPALCYVSPVVDEMVHGATQGVNDVHASLDLWLTDAAQSTHSAQWLEGLIQLLLDQHYLVAITSDQGHVAAVGMGQPQEGVLVESRSRRARIYDQEEFAQNVQHEYPDTVLWHDDGLLPPDRWVLLPSGL